MVLRRYTHCSCYHVYDDEPTVGMGKTHYLLSNHMQVNNENAAVETNTNSSCKFYLLYFTLIQFNSFIFGL